MTPGTALPEAPNLCGADGLSCNAYGRRLRLKMLIGSEKRLVPRNCSSGRVFFPYEEIPRRNRPPSFQSRG
jgi:hypothetical protein